MPRLRIMGKAITFPTVFSSFWAQSCRQEVSVREVEGIKSFASTGGLTFFIFTSIIPQNRDSRGLRNNQSKQRNPHGPPSWGKSSLLPSSRLREIQGFDSFKGNCFSTVHFRRVNWFLPMFRGVTWFTPHFRRVVWLKETCRAF